MPDTSLQQNEHPRDQSVFLIPASNFKVPLPPLNFTAESANVLGVHEGASESTVSLMSRPPTHVGSVFSKKQPSAISTGSQAYRAVLLKHRVEILQRTNNPRPIQKIVQDLALNMITRKRNEPSPTAAESAMLHEVIWQLELDGEATLVTDLVPYLISPIFHAQALLRKGANQEWTSSAMPHVPNMTHGPVSIPKPDLQYSFKPSAFTQDQRTIMDHSLICNYSQPLLEHYFTFLVFEFKSDAAGGSFRHAERQAAGAGALAVNSLRSFLKIAQTNSDPPKMESKFFSCTMNASYADLWVHWCEPDEDSARKDRFYSTRVGRYTLEEPDQVQRFQAALRNIVDWAMEERLPLIRTALSRIKDNGGEPWLDQKLEEAQKHGTVCSASARASRRTSRASTKLDFEDRVLDGRVTKAASDHHPSSLRSQGALVHSVPYTV